MKKLLIFTILSFIYAKSFGQVEFYGFDNIANYNSWNYETNMNPLSWSYDAPNEQINYVVNSSSIPYQTSTQFISRELLNPVGYQFIASFKLNRQIAATNSYFPLLFTPSILTGTHLHPWRMNPPVGGNLGGQQSNGLLGVIITHNNIGIIHRTDGLTNGAVGMISGYILPINQNLWIRLERICATTVKLEVYEDSAMTVLLAGQTFTVNNPGNSLEGLYIANCNGNGTTTNVNDLLDDYTIQNVSSAIPTFNTVGPFCAGSAISPLPTTSLNGVVGSWSPAINNNATTTYTFTPANSSCYNQTTMTVEISNSNIIPTFNIDTNICLGETILPLPLISQNGIEGSWSPNVNNTSTTTYTFTPNSGQCASGYIATIVVSQVVLPTFDTCSGVVLSNLPTISNEGIEGIWSNNNNNIPNNFTFTPNINQCTNNIDVTFYNPPVSSFFSNNVCEGEEVIFVNNSSSNTGTIVNYTWDFGDGNTSIDQNPSHLFSSPGEYNVLLVSESNNQCVDSVINTIEIYPNPSVNFQFNLPCEGEIISFIDNTQINGGQNNFITEWNWDFGSFASLSNVQNPNVEALTTGSYTAELSVVSNNGCEGTVEQNFTVNPTPVASFISSSNAGCSNLCVTFENTSTLSSGNITNFLWDFGNGVTSNDIYPTTCFENGSEDLVNFDVSLTVTSDVGCVNSFLANDYISIFENVEAIFETGISENLVEFNNLSTNADFSSWIFDTLGSSVEFSPEFLFPSTDNQEYVVCLTVESSEGCIDSVCENISFTQELYNYIPNAFTPNSDGINDVFTPVLNNISEFGFEFMIFDRWGLLVFESTNLNQLTWDGKYKNVDAPEDIYIWKLKGVSDNEIKKVINSTGHITLIR